MTLVWVFHFISPHFPNFLRSLMSYVLSFKLGNSWREVQYSFSLYILLMFQLLLQLSLNLWNSSNSFCKWLEAAYTFATVRKYLKPLFHKLPNKIFPAIVDMKNPNRANKFLFQNSTINRMTYFNISF